ncbi:MAG: SGNH/GDSL hydrolase family protein, partial [Terriglobus roseus]|nr:SGNH/GDSL hydrolase family protein [Terriglobus roseus]
MEQPSASNPLGNPPYPGVTTSNGPNWVNLLATTYNQSLVLTYDFAFGGATVDQGVVAAYNPGVISMRRQVEELYLPKYAAAPATAPWTARDSLFAFFIGINDVGNSYGEGDHTTNGRVMERYAELVEKVYGSGARNFVFFMVPPVDRAPMIGMVAASLGDGVAAVARKEAAAIADWNRRMVDMVSGFTRRRRDATAFVFDTHGLYSQILDRPGQYAQTAGLRNTTDFCVEY